MNKSEVAKKIANHMAISQKEALLFVKTFERVVEESFLNGNNIALQGFGSFHLWEQSERQGRNPRTGTPACIYARNSVKFRPGKNLLKALNRK